MEGILVMGIRLGCFYKGGCEGFCIWKLVGGTEYLLRDWQVCESSDGEWDMAEKSVCAWLVWICLVFPIWPSVQTSILDV